MLVICNLDHVADRGAEALDPDQPAPKINRSTEWVCRGA